MSLHSKENVLLKILKVFSNIRVPRKESYGDLWDAELGNE